jgi:16S rRNA C967 or C1407 C5-methylase (RsmB/RsmF family)
MEERFVKTMSGQIANDETIEFRLPKWMKEAMIEKFGKKNISSYLRALVLNDFIDVGIQEPKTDEEIRLLNLEMEDFH